MTLGMAICFITMLLVFQSVPALVISPLVIYLSRLSAISEADNNNRKFGGAYQEYMRHVPMWNFFQNLKR